MTRYWVSDAVRYRVVDGLGVVLDLSTERYSVLDESATSAWAMLTGFAEAESVVERWTSEYAIGRDDAELTVTHFAEECLKSGWLQLEPPKARIWARTAADGLRWQQKIPRILVAIAALAVTAMSLKTKGFANTYRAGNARAGMRTREEEGQLTGPLSAFLFAENFLFSIRGINDCLYRSLAVHRYLRWLGFPAVHVIGVRRAPFAAHAWVEVNGEGVLAPAPRGYSRLATLALAE